MRIDFAYQQLPVIIEIQVYIAGGYASGQISGPFVGLHHLAPCKGFGAVKRTGGVFGKIHSQYLGILNPFLPAAVLQ